MVQPRILIVEDDVLIGMMLVDIFEELGLAEPVQVTSNRDALAYLEQNDVRAALVDINLEGEKGWPVADALNARHIPFAFTSGGGDALPPAHSTRQILSKPFRLSDVEKILSEITENHA